MKDLNEIASVTLDFYFWVKFDLVLIYMLKIYRKKSLWFYWEKICSIHYLHFPFEKHLPSQVLKNFSVENLETTPSTFFSKCFCEICLSRIINYWGSVFTLYITWGAFSLICVLSVFFFLSFFSFFSVFSLIDTNDSVGLQGRERKSLFFLFLTSTC